MLIFALIIVTTIALVTGALLSKGWGNFAATVSLRNVAGQAYTADAAAKIAINDIVYGGSSTVPSSVASYPNGIAGTPASWVYDNNTDGTGCFGKKASDGSPLTSLDLSKVYTLPDGTIQSATIVCRPVLGTGLFGSGNGTVPVTPAATDAFARALTTVGTGTSGTAVDGITFKGLGSGSQIPIRGSIESNSFINVQAGTLQTNGTITANPNSACTTSNSGAMSPTCSGTYIPPDPSSVTAPLSAVPTWRDPAAQGCSFQPGFYNNGLALSNAVNACGTATFASGKYYFDFADGKPWDISTTVIGGQAGAGSSIPGRCVSPIDSPTTAGVQFVFGGSSTMKLEDTSNVELCGPANGGYAPITIYQQQTGTTPTPTTTPGMTSSNVTTRANTGGGDKTVAFAANGGSSPTLTSALQATGNPTADWKASGNNSTGELDLQAFGANLNGIPVGSTITAAKLNVTYTTKGGTGSNPFAGTLSVGVSGQAGTVPLAATGTDTDIAALLNAQLANGAFTATTPKIQILVGGSTNNNDSFSVDAATLTVTYVTPALRQWSAVIGSPTPTPGQFIYQQGGNFAGKFVVQGATYAPNGYINLVPGSSANALVAFRWGIVAWGVNFKSQPSQLWGYPLVSIPDPGYGLGSAVTAVDLQVYVCSGSGPCAATGNPALTSRVQFTDGLNDKGIVSPVAGQRQVNVLSWAEQR
ncbi:MAG TPA: hypothetical protein VJ872_04000 [Nocardioides sp.]|nr:hypothetical protein [Nocardioides sp.]